MMEDDAILCRLLLAQRLARPLEEGLRVLATDAGLVLDLLQLAKPRLAVMGHVDAKLSPRGRVRVVCCHGVAVHGSLHGRPIELILRGHVLKDAAVRGDRLHDKGVVPPQVVGHVLEGLGAQARSLQHEVLVALEVIGDALHAGAIADLASRQNELLVASQLVTGAAERRTVDGHGLHDEVLVTPQRIVCLRQVLAFALDRLKNKFLVLAELAWRPFQHLALAQGHASEEEVAVGQDLLRGVLELGPIAEDHGAPARMAEALQRDVGGARLLSLGRCEDAISLRGLVHSVHQHRQATKA
mmetsp:Transcript_27113/g.61766  ORF Transcript_27113/g.61766 Transcript_27113/m.61766 type:complete len:299 (+) Transcript_27113:906-1802(+)